MNHLPEGFGLVLKSVPGPKNGRVLRRLVYVLVTPHHEVRLTEQQGRIMALLVHGYNKEIPVGHMFDALWGDDDDSGPETWDNVVKVQICHLRRKMRSIGIDFDYKFRSASYITMNNLRECEPYGTTEEAARQVRLGKVKYQEQKAREEKEASIREEFSRAQERFFAFTAVSLFEGSAA